MNHTLAVSDGTNSTADGKTHVVREPRELSNVTTTGGYGNIFLSPAFWPMIQLYDFSDDQVVDIDYNKGSNTEEVDLIYMDNPLGLVLDKPVYGLNHEVGVEIIDFNLNIDPTDEDSWTFGTNPGNATAFYQLYDENGTADSAGNAGVLSTFANTGDAMSGTWGIAGILTIDRDGAEDAKANTTSFQANADSASDMVCSANITSAGGTASQSTTYGVCSTKNINAVDQAMTMVETGANTGHFVNWDDALKTSLLINTDAARGSTSTINYDGDNYSILHMPSFGSVEFDTSGIGADWNSGEIVNVNIIDEDQNYDVITHLVMRSTLNVLSQQQK
jgi:hypothetical protein